MIKILKKNFLIKILIILFWISIVFLFLFSPVLKNHFFKTKSINILTWADMIDQKIVSKFEQETGIKVNLSFYETHEEVFAKLQMTGGKNYDLVTITDAGIKLLSENGLFKKIDKTKLSFWDTIDSRFLNHYFDSENQYSIPYNWDIFGLGIDQNYFKNKPFVQSWAMIFDEKFMPKKITMLEDPYDNIFISAQYLYGNTKNIDNKKLDEIKHLLIKQKPKVEAYGDLKADYYLKSKICPVVSSQSAYVYRAFKNNSDFKFVLPKEGGFIVIDSIAILNEAKNIDLIYKFLNYLYDEKKIKKLHDNFGYLPVIKSVLNSANLDYMGGRDFILSPETFSKLSFFRRYVLLDKVSDLWVSLKAS